MSCDTPLVTAEGAPDDLRVVAGEPHVEFVYVVQAPADRRTAPIHEGAEELAGRVHALALTALTPEEG